MGTEGFIESLKVGTRIRISARIAGYKGRHQHLEIASHFPRPEWNHRNKIVNDPEPHRVHDIGDSGPLEHCSAPTYIVEDTPGFFRAATAEPVDETAPLTNPWKILNKSRLMATLLDCFIGLIIVPHSQTAWRINSLDNGNLSRDFLVFSSGDYIAFLTAVVKLTVPRR